MVFYESRCDKLLIISIVIFNEKWVNTIKLCFTFNAICYSRWLILITFIRIYNYVAFPSSDWFFLLLQNLVKAASCYTFIVNRRCVGC